jgi:phenylalanyl-tRNA synthetase beta chain
MRIAPENTRSLFDIRHLLADLEYQETVNFSFVEEAWEADFAGNTNPVRLLNPIASQMSVMRTSLIASLVANVRYNVNRKLNRVRLFEVGAVYLHNAEAQDGPLSVAGYHQPKRVAAIAYGPAVEEQWGLPGRNVDYFDIKADLEALFAPKMLRFVKVEHPALHPGRSAQVILDGKVIGMIGELHPRWQQKYDLPLAPVVFEVDAAALQARDIPVYREISKFPAVTRDIAVVVKQSLQVQELIDAFVAEGKANPACAIMQAVVLFDEYRGKGLENDEKSLAFRFTLQDTQTTLQDEKVDAAMSAFVASVEQKYGAKLRT